MEHFFQNKTILLTGASGYIATSILAVLSRYKCRLICVSRSQMNISIFEQGQAELLHVESDLLNDLSWLDHAEQADIIYHLAAQTSVYVAEENPIKDLEVNVLVLLKLLNSLFERKVKPIVIVAGTATQVGLTEQTLVNEEVADDPVTFYDIHKLHAEQSLKQYIRNEHVRGACLRLANVYGPGVASSTAGRGILNMMVRRALRGEPLTLYGEGTQVRDYVYIDDVVQAFLAVAKNIDATNGGHYIVGSGVGHSLLDAYNMIIDKVKEISSEVIELKHVKPPGELSPIEFRDFIADPSELKHATAWSPKFSLGEGIGKTIEHFSR
jgi:UDP-glucose 4-epimerase